MKLKIKRLFSSEAFNTVLLLLALLTVSAVVSFVNVLVGFFAFSLTFILTAISVYRISYFNRMKALEQSDNFNDTFIGKCGQVMLSVGVDDKIIWYGGAYGHYFPEYAGSKPTLSRLTGDVLSAKYLMEYNETNNGEAFSKEINGYTFKIRSEEQVISGRKCNLITMTDITELEGKKLLLKQKEIVVAYAMIDNASEAMVYANEKSREASLKISTALHQWVQSVNGIIREYDRDKYIIFFEAKFLDELIKNKFAFMEAINTGNGDIFEIPLTLSLGVAYIEGDLFEKEEAAKNTLELALQRGGAQTAVKTKDGTYVFGGRVRTVQKQTKIRSRVVANQLVSMICSASNVIIMGHKNADYDCIASCTGLARLCLHCGVKVNVVVNFNDKDVRNAIEHLDKEVFSEIFVDSVAGQDLVETETLVITSDVSNPTIFECVEIVDNAKTHAVIDHHRQAKEFDRKPDLVYIEPTASSASELVCEILEHVLPPETTLREEANLLYAGILLDTQSFARNTGVRTFGAAIFLNTLGGSIEKGRDMLKADASEYKKLAEIQSGVSVFKSVYAITIYDSGENTADNRVMASKAADSLLGIDGIKATFVLTALEDGIHISARSDGSINVALILEQIGGGGHFNMAGAKLEEVDIESAVLKLKDAIDKYDR